MIFTFEGQTLLFTIQLYVKSHFVKNRWDLTQLSTIITLKTNKILRPLFWEYKQVANGIKSLSTDDNFPVTTDSTEFLEK